MRSIDDFGRNPDQEGEILMLQRAETIRKKEGRGLGERKAGGEKQFSHSVRPLFQAWGISVSQTDGLRSITESGLLDGQIHSSDRDTGIFLSKALAS